MPPLKINTFDAGGVAYLTWLRTPSNVQPVTFINDNIFPTQDMLAFQGRWFYLNGGIAVPQSDSFLFQAECPIDESWRIDYIIVEHTSDANLDFEIEIIPKGVFSISLERIIARMDVENGTEQCLYPTETEIGNVTRNDTFTYNGERLIILPGETFVIKSAGTPDVGGTTVELTVRYENVPVPIEQVQISATIPSVTAVT